MAINAGNSFRTRDKLNVGRSELRYSRLEFLEEARHRRPGKAFPFSTAHPSGESFCGARMARFVHAEDIRALANWRPGAPEKEDRLHARAAAFCCRTSLGYLAIVDLATMRRSGAAHGRAIRSEIQSAVPWPRAGPSTIPCRSIIWQRSTPSD